MVGVRDVDAAKFINAYAQVRPFLLLEYSIPSTFCCNQLFELRTPSTRLNPVAFKRILLQRLNTDKSEHSFSSARAASLFLVRHVPAV